jgi:hypothetical protein
LNVEFKKEREIKDICSKWSEVKEFIEKPDTLTKL